MFSTFTDVKMLLPPYRFAFAFFVTRKDHEAHYNIE